MEVLGFPNGVCTVEGHGPKLNVGGDARCVKCDAAAQRATRTHIPVVTVKDPGPEAFDAHGRLKPGYVGPKDEASTAVVPVHIPANSIPQAPTVTAGKPVNAVTLLVIREAIYRLPMPKSMAQYKRFLKIQQLIDQCVSEEQNG